MDNQRANDRPLLRRAHEKLNDVLANIERYPALVPYEAELRNVRDRVFAIVEPPSGDFDLNGRALDAVYALVDEVAQMPLPVKRCVAAVVFRYIGEQLVKLEAIKVSRPFTEEEKRFVKERLIGLLDRFQEVINAKEA